jgi:outer membrane lipoprotein-sorting protein
MKKLMLLGALALLVTSSDAQSPAPDKSQQLQALLKEVQAQQIQLAENQAKIEAKLVTLAEAIRIAKIYASRGGR